MTPESVIAFGQHALYVAILVAAPLLLTALAVGLLIGVIQAATQINEMTLSFIPKLIAMAVVASGAQRRRAGRSRLRRRPSPPGWGRSPGPP